MDTRKATDDALLPNCIPEEWKAAKVRDLKLKKGGSELYWISGKEDNKDLLLPRSLAQVEVPAIASELVKRWNVHADLLAALKHVEGHWKATEDTGDNSFALDLASCETCRTMVGDAIDRSRSLLGLA